MKKVRRRALHVFLIVGSVFLLGVAVFITVISIYIHKNIDTDVSGIIMLSGNRGMPSRIYAMEDGEMTEVAAGEISAGKNSVYASLEEIPDHLQKAFIAIEDKRFYSHRGFDFITTVKATFKYFFSSGQTPGGSTITQQLIKNLTGEDEVTVQRKAEEILRAVALEKELSKDAILELYLNTIYLSGGTYGVKAAARFYFNKEVSELSLIESAAIAAITQAPTKWNPILHPNNNAERRDLILNEMLEQGYIRPDEYEEAYGKELVLSVNAGQTTVSASSWYTDAVINEAIQLLSEQLDISRKVASQYLFNGGYQIFVAQDPALQKTLEAIYQDPALFGVEGVQSSFVIMDPTNGNILALVGGLGEKQGSRVLNRATQSLRSPGSSIKPLSVYAPAIEAGLIHYGSVFDDTPVTWNSATKTVWPHNANGVYAGLVPLEYALSRSLNTVSVKVLEKLGTEESFRFLTEELGFDSLDEEEDCSLSALAMGGMKHGVTLAQLVSGYTALANNGIYSQGRTVLKITDSSGRILVDNEPEQRIVLSEETTQTMTKLLTKVITENGGTAHGGITSLTSQYEVAGKTGTTDDNKDRWFVGYTPHLLAGIWLGYDTPSSLSGIATKKHIAVWDRIMTEIEKEYKPQNSTKTFDYGLLVEARYCTCSGDLPTSACRADPRGNCTAIGFFTRNTIPGRFCHTHLMVPYCTEGGGVAGTSCPHETVEYRGLLVVDRSFPFDITVSDVEYTAMRLPEDYRPYMDLTKAYYNYYVKAGTCIGKSRRTSPYNRFCTRHIPPVAS